MLGGRNVFWDSSHCAKLGLAQYSFPNRPAEHRLPTSLRYVAKLHKVKLVEPHVRYPPIRKDFSGLHGSKVLGKQIRMSTHYNAVAEIHEL